MSPRTSRLALVAILLAFLALRLPTALRQGGATDEEWYAIPGLTVAREGIPRVPYSRATEPGSVFLGADRLLLAMPPLSFYAQAPFFAVGPVGCGTARLASLLAGCAAIVLVYAIARALGWGASAGLWGAAIYSTGRLLYFPAQIARPDMACGALGLAAIWAMARWAAGPDRRPRRLALAGAFLGLGGLAHPFALVFAVQVGLWAALAPGGWRRRSLRAVGVAAMAAAVALGLWLPLILRAPDLFRAQFVANILDPTGPGLLARLAWPWPDAAEHLPLVAERAGRLPTVALVGLMAVASAVAWRRRDRALGLVAGLGWSSVYLLLALQGRHPLQGYWCYPAAFFALAAGRLTARAVERGRVGSRAAGALAVGLWAVALVPGSGLRATWACVRHRGDVNYDPIAFTRSILADVPVDARVSVGAEYALEAYGLRGDRVVLAIHQANYFDSTRVPYDYAILGRTALERDFQRALRGRVVRTYGDAADPFSCFAALVEPDPAAPPPAR